MTALYKSHEKIYPREVKGPFQTVRRGAGASVLMLYFLLPWFQWQGRQAVLFDLEQREFHIFTITFWPQDFFLLAWLLIIAALSLFLITAIAGRIWCGYTCPQTVWTDLFLAIERFTEGNHRARRRMDQQPLNANTVLRKTSKHILWALLALWTGITFVGYFSPISDVLNRAVHFELSAWYSFWIIFYSLATYTNAGYLREQVCQYICPYARFQSAMLDKQSMVIAYDQQRGEPRRSTAGDCVDCGICVSVCPTGIDIRNGLQYECIGCAACIDGCNDVMKKSNRPTGLIRYSTELNSKDNGINQEGNNPKHRDRSSLFSTLFRPRVVVYLALWTLLSVCFILFLVNRPLLTLDVIRDRSAFFYQTAPGYIDNHFLLKLANRHRSALHIKLSTENLSGAMIHLRRPDKKLKPGELLQLPITVRAPLPMPPHASQNSSEKAPEQSKNPQPFYIKVEGVSEIEALSHPEKARSESNRILYQQKRETLFWFPKSLTPDYSDSTALNKQRI